MAQIGTDIVETITATGAAFVAPFAMSLVGFAPSMTVGTTTGTRTQTVTVGATPVGQTASVGATLTEGAPVVLTAPVAVPAGTKVTVAGSGGTGSPAGDTVALWLQRA